MHGTDFHQRFTVPAEVRPLLRVDVDGARTRPHGVIEKRFELRPLAHMRDHQGVARRPIEAGDDGREQGTYAERDEERLWPNEAR